MFGLKNVIKKPTRVTASSETIIDLIISSEPSKVIKSGSLDPGISDHKLDYSVINLQKPVKKPRIKMVKNYKTMNIDEFKKTLEDTPWWVTNIFDDVDDVVNAWELLYKGVVDDYVTERKAKVRTDSLPWFTTDLRKLLNKRFKLLKKWQKTKDPQIHTYTIQESKEFSKEKTQSSRNKLLET